MKFAHFWEISYSLTNKLRRVDRRTYTLLTDRPTNQPTDTASYRGALSHLKKENKDRVFILLLRHDYQPQDGEG